MANPTKPMVTIPLEEYIALKLDRILLAYLDGYGGLDNGMYQDEEYQRLKKEWDFLHMPAASTICALESLKRGPDTSGHTADTLFEDLNNG